MGNPGEYRRWGIWVSTGKGRIRESTGNGDPGRYKKNRNLGEYQRRAWMSTGRKIGEGVESERVPENHQIKKG